MLWDESFQSWAELGVSLQPGAQLYSADGVLLEEWLGPFDESEVLALVEGASPTQPAAEEAGADSDRFCRYGTRFARAQADAAAYRESDAEGRQRMIDDLRYAANALAQTATGDDEAGARRLAAAVRDYVEVIVDAGLPDSMTADALAAQAGVLRSELEANQALLSTACGVELELVERPAPDPT